MNGSSLGSFILAEMAGVPADILKNPSDAEGIKGFLRNCGESAGQVCYVGVSVLREWLVEKY